MIFGDDALVLRPKLAAQALQVIAVAAQVEMALSELLIQMLGAHAGPAIGMYSELSSTTAQMAAVRGAARAVLPADRLQILEIVLSIAGRAARERNRLAHWSWGYSVAWKDRLILMDPEIRRNMSVRFEIAMREGGTTPVDASSVLDTKRILVYQSKDFEEARSRLFRAQVLVSRFAKAVSAREKEPDELFRQLLGEPEIREVLERQSKGKKRSQAKPR